jgi:hypothetical protein
MVTVFFFCLFGSVHFFVCNLVFTAEISVFGLAIQKFGFVDDYRLGHSKERLAINLLGLVVSGFIVRSVIFFHLLRFVSCVLCI